MGTGDGPGRDLVGKFFGARNSGRGSGRIPGYESKVGSGYFCRVLHLWRRIDQQPAKIWICTAASRSIRTCSQSFYRKFSKRPCCNIGSYLYDSCFLAETDGRFASYPELFHDGSDRAYDVDRWHPGLPGRSLSNGCFGGLVHRSGLGGHVLHDQDEIAHVMKVSIFRRQ